MQRSSSSTPATTSAGASPVVYRSLPISATTPSTAFASVPRVGAENNGKLQTTTKNNTDKTVAASVSTATNTTNRDLTCTNLPFPPVPVASLQNGAIWKEELDLCDLHKKLMATCTDCQVKRTNSTCEFQCSAQADDGNEQCFFTLNIWQVPPGEEGAYGKYLIQVDRSAGCPYFFRQVMTKTFDIPDNPKKGKCLFRVPKLPECMCDKGEGIRPECVESAITLATSEVYEQRLQGVNVLADLCCEKSPQFVALFKSADGPSRISQLQSDSDCWIKKAVSRILAYCSA